MALSDAKRFSEYSKNSGDGDYNNTSDVFKWVFLTDDYTTIDADMVSPQLSSFTQVTSSGNYVANTTITNTTWSRTGNTTTLNGDSFSFAADPLNPVTAKSLLIYNDTSATKDALMVVDLTVDGGTTPANTTQGMTYTIPAQGMVATQRV